MNYIRLFFMKLLFIIILFFIGFSTILEASRPASKINSYQEKQITQNYSSKSIRLEKRFYSDSTQQTKIEILPEKPKKNGLGMIIWGSFLALLGVIFGIGLLLIFLLGFTIGSGFYFKDIYAIAGVMLTGLIIFGIGIYMITRGIERWKIYKRYKKALKNIQKNPKNL